MVVAGLTLAPPEATGPFRRERLRNARLYFVCDARPAARTPTAAPRRAERWRRHRAAAGEGAGPPREIERAALTFRRLCDTYGALSSSTTIPTLRAP